MTRHATALHHRALVLLVTAVLVTLTSASVANAEGRNATEGLLQANTTLESVVQQVVRPELDIRLTANQPLTQAQVDAQLNAVVVNNLTATQEFLASKPDLSADGGSIVMIVTLRVYGTYAQANMRKYIAAHMQGTHWSFPQTGLVARYHFTNDFSSTRGHLASKTHQATIRKFQLEEMVACDLTFSYGTPKGKSMPDPISVSFMAVIARAISAHVKKAGFRQNGEHFTPIGLAWPKKFHNAKQIWWNQEMTFQVRLTGQNLEPFIPERQTAAWLAFRDASAKANLPLVSFNISSFIVQHQQRRLLGNNNDIIDITLLAAPAPVDWYTPRQAMDAILNGSTFEDAAAWHGVPMTARLLQASMVTNEVISEKKETDGLKRRRRVTGPDDVSGFLTDQIGGPAAPLRLKVNAATASSHTGGSAAAPSPSTFIAALAACAVAAFVAAVFVLARRRGRSFAGGSKAGSKDVSDASVSSDSDLSWSSRSSQSTLSVTSQRLLTLLRHPTRATGAKEEMIPLAGSGSTRTVQLSAENDSREFQGVGEEVAFCTDAQGRRVVLGRGSWGHIYLATRYGTQEVAVKVIDRDGHSKSWLHLLRREVAILQRISFDRNIVQYYGACLEGDRAMLVMEYCEGGDLRRAMQSVRGPELAWCRGGRAVALDVARGLRFCHVTGVIHRDLKSSNVLLTAEGVAKIGDVGLARLVGAAGDTSSLAVAGTFSFAAPELLMGTKVTEKSDSYSFGVLLWEIVTQEVPIRGQMRELQCPQEAPEELADLIEACMEVDPDARPSSHQIFEALQAIPHPEPGARAKLLARPEQLVAAA